MNNESKFDSPREAKLNRSPVMPSIFVRNTSLADTLARVQKTFGVIHDCKYVRLERHDYLHREVNDDEDILCFFSVPFQGNF